MSYGPPTFDDFDQAATRHAANAFETQATRVVSPESPEPQRERIRPFSGAPSILSLLAEWGAWLVLWGFLRLLPLGVNPEFVPFINFLSSAGIVVSSGLLLAIVLLALEQRLHSRIRAVRAKWLDGLDEESDCDELRAIHRRLAQVSRIRSSSTLALVAYILVRGL